MKKINPFGNEKLRLKKQAIANLSKPDMAQVQGGEAAFTTSFARCSGFLCCNRMHSVDILCLDLPPSVIFSDIIQQPSDDIK